MCKLTLFLTLVLSVNAFADALAQNKMVTLNLQNASFEQVIQSLKSQTELGFFFNIDNSEINKISDLNLNFKNAKLDDVLKSILDNTNLTYSIVNDVVIIKEKEPVKTQQEITLLNLVGKVVDKQNYPLPGVTVKIVGTSVGTATKVDGTFSLTIPMSPGELEFSFVGFKTQKVKFNNETRDSLRIVLEENITDLDEVAVVAYGTTTRRETTGSISVVRSEEWEGIPAVSITDLLQGRVAGMDITNLSGAPGGGGTAITIRGYNSMNVDQETRNFSNPLWVVDGVPLNTFVSPVTGTNLLADINPDMIESIQVLKDASSAAIYGSRAANGVIIVTTKKGKNNQKATLSINVSQTWSIIPKLPTVTIGKGERDYRLKALYNFPRAYLDSETGMWKYPTTYEELYKNPISGLNAFEWMYPDGWTIVDGHVIQDSLNTFYNNSTNFFPMYTHTGRVTNANIQSYGGSENISYSLGLGFYDESGVYRGSGFNRLTLNSNMNIMPVPNLKLDTRFDITLTNRKRSDRGGGNNSIDVVPGNPFELSSLLPGKGSDTWSYVVENLQKIKENNRNFRVRGSFNISYDIIEGLNFSTLNSMDYSIQRRQSFSPSFLNNSGYSKSEGTTRIDFMALTENLISYKKSINDLHNFNAIVGLSYQYDQTELNNGRAENSPSDKIEYAPNGMPDYTMESSGSFQTVRTFKNYISDMQEKALLSYFGRLEYNYMQKYLLSLSIRRDGSSVFGKNNRWGTFPAIAAGWTFTDEAFMSSTSGWFNFGKIRASWGRSGLHFSQTYLALGLMNVGPTFQGNASLEPTWQNGLYNDDLSWEETDQYDIGLDLDFLNYRLTVTMDYYYRHTRKLLDEIVLPGAFDYTPYELQWRNAGEISNEGIEILVKYDIFRKKDLIWKVSVNAARNWNLFKNSYNDKDFGGRIIGKSLNGVYAIAKDGFVEYQDELPIYYNAAGEGKYLSNGSNSFYKPGDYKYIDTNGDGLIGDRDYTYSGSALPKVSGGIVNEFRWKNIDLNMSLSYQIGRHIVNTNKLTSLYTYLTYEGSMHPLLLDLSKVTFWEKPGDMADFPMIQTDNSPQMLVTKDMVEKVNWLKLKTITCGYNIPSRITRKWKIEQLRIFASAENLFTITNYSGLDPETVSIVNGFDEGRNYPLARKLTLGLTLRF